MKKPRYSRIITEKEKIDRKMWIINRRSELEQKWLKENGGKPIVRNREEK